MAAPHEAAPPSEEESFLNFPPRSPHARPEKRLQDFWASEPATPPAAPSMTPKGKAWLEFQVSSPEASFTPRGHVNSEPYEDYTEVFLCHARLYVFADRYDIQPLRRLSKQNLHQLLLSDFRLYTERVRDVVALLRYVYENTPHRAHTRDELRELVMQYVVCQYEKMAPSDEFLDLMEKGAACVRDCLSMLSGIVE